MMKLIFYSAFLFLLFILNPAFASGPKGRLKFGVGFYPNVSNSIISSTPEIAWAADYYHEIKRPKFSFGGNLFLEYAMGLHSRIIFGLGYLNYGDQTKQFTTDFTFPGEIDPFYGFVQPTAVPENSAIKFIYNYHSIEIPVQYKYAWQGGVYAQGGASAVINIAQTQTLWQKTDGEKATRNTTDHSQSANFRALNIGLNAGAGYTFFKQSKVNWFVGLNAQYLVLPVAIDAAINRTYFSGGLATGILF